MIFRDSLKALASKPWGTASSRWPSQARAVQASAISFKASMRALQATASWSIGGQASAFLE